MKKMINTVRLMAGIAVLSWLGNPVQAQQIPMYSQYMFNMLNINPAYAGQQDNGTFHLLYRNQWTSFPGAPVSGSISYDNRLTSKNSGLGIQFYSDKIGIEKTTGMQGFYSYQAKFNERSSLSLGMSMGLLNYATDYTRTNALDPGDPLLTETIRATLPTAGFGALWQSKNWYVGFSMPALFKTKLYSKDQPKLQGAGQDAHLFLNTGVYIKLDDDVTLQPSLLLKAVQGTPVQADLNCHIWLKKLLGLGVSYRTKNAVVGMAQVKLGKGLQLGYAYDHNISKLISYTSGTHEIMFRFELRPKPQPEPSK